MKNVFKFLILLIISLSLTGLSLGCNKQTATPAPSPSSSATEAPKSDLTNLDPSTVMDEMKNDYRTAQQKSTGWLADAQIYSASAKITPSLNLQDVIEVFTFGSNTQAVYWWTISISMRSKNYVRAIIPKEDYLGPNLEPLVLAYWKMNYVEAFQIAEKNGGKDWRSQQTNADYQTTVTLAMGDPNNYLYWTVEYQNSDGTEKKSIQINANNGEVVNQEI